MPSGPGDLLFFIYLIAAFTSSSVVSESKNSTNTGGSPSVSECSEGRFSTLLLKSFSKWANQSSLVMLFVAGGFLLCFLI